MTTTFNPLAVLHRAARLGLDLEALGCAAQNKATYFHTAEDNFALFNYYNSLGDLARYVHEFGKLPFGITFPDGTRQVKVRHGLARLG